MAARIRLSGGAVLRLTRANDRVRIQGASDPLELTLEEAWRLAEALDALATAGEEPR